MRRRYLMAMGVLLMSLLILAAQCPNGTRPVAIFNADPTSGPSPLEVSFDASASYDPDGTIVSYAWDFGDTMTGAGETTTHTFSAISDRTYTVKLTVTDDDGKQATATKDISIDVPSPGTPLFFDDFSTGGSSAWSSTPGWRVSYGRYYYSHVGASWGYSYVVPGLNWQDYALEADVEVGFLAEAGFILRAQQDLNNMLIVSGNFDEIRWTLVVDGEPALTSHPVSPGFFSGEQHVRVEAHGTVYKLFVEGLLRSTFENSYLLSGMPGLASKDVYGSYDLATKYDNFKVTSIP